MLLLWAGVEVAREDDVDASVSDERFDGAGCFQGLQLAFAFVSDLPVRLVVDEQNRSQRGVEFSCRCSAGEIGRVDAIGDQQVDLGRAYRRPAGDDRAAHAVRVRRPCCRTWHSSPKSSRT
jgi:hypothetical protein